jgi:hypothetical protein
LRDVLTAYGKYSEANDKLTAKFNEDITMIINKLFDMLKCMEDVTSLFIKGKYEH